MMVSVIIPTYNRAGMLADAIDSALRQTYPDREIIVVDDGSTDDTSSVLARYGDAVRVIKQQNRGAGVARNRALEDARGDLIAFLDSDDEWLDFKLSLQVEILRARPDVGFVFTEFRVRKDEDGRALHAGCRRWLNGDVDWNRVYPSAQSSTSLGLQLPPSVEPFTLYSGRMYRQLLHHYHILPTTSIVRRSLIGSGIRFAEGPIVFEDWEFFARLSRDHDAAFADVETAINRGHQTPGRLTLCSRLVKYRAHVAIIERVWETDGAFMAEYGLEVRRLKSNLLATIARDALLDAKPDLAREALKRRRQLRVSGPRVDSALYSVLSHTPGGARALQLARRTIHLARAVAHRDRR